MKIHLKSQNSLIPNDSDLKVCYTTILNLNYFRNLFGIILDLIFATNQK